MSIATPPSIAIIVGSQRTPRAGDQITSWVHQTLFSSPASSNLKLTLLDLAAWSIPLCDESGVPSQIHSASEYDHEHTRRWSNEISSHSAFIFVTPQYNWGYPAGLKNAIDYLYNEWKGKPAMVVSYGGHGGGKAGWQLKQVLEGVRMRPTGRNIELTFPGREFMVKAARGEDLGLGKDEGMAGEEGIWEKEKVDIVEVFKEMIELLGAEKDVMGI